MQQARRSIGFVVASLLWVSSHARAETSLPASGVVARPPSGLHLVPYVGVNSFQGDTGQGSGVGLRVGLLAGSRMAERWSLNLGLAFDKINAKASGVSAFAFDLGIAPLIHFPQEKFEILVGPVLGSFVDHLDAGSGAFEMSGWTYGWTIGANAGAMVPVGSKVSVGGLINFMLRNPIKACTTFMGSDNCLTDNLPSEKVLALTAAAMF